MQQFPVILIIGVVIMPISGLPTKFFARDFVNDFPMFEAHANTKLTHDDTPSSHFFLLFVIIVTFLCFLAIIKYRKSIGDVVVFIFRTIQDRMDSAHRDYRSPTIRYNRMASMSRSSSNPNDYNELVSHSTALP